MKGERLRRASRLAAVSTLVLASLVAVQSSAPAGPAECSTTAPAAGFGVDGNEMAPGAAAAVERELHSRLAALDPAAKALAAPTAVPVYVHVITPDQPAAGSAVTDRQISQQLAVLNQGYAGGFTFKLAGTDRTVNNDWFYDLAVFSAQDQAMRKALHKGGANALNIYTVQLAEFAGYAAFPWDYKARPDQDGIVLHYGVLPGGDWAGINTGKIGIHEVGHWLGLYHTFEGKGCAPPGDYVDDTPAQYDASRGGCQQRDTCPSPGLDPIHNHMDYTTDSCRTHFTVGQQNRTLQAWQAFRAPA